MTLWQAIFLGVIQGATEFLPISSDGHLVLLPSLLNMPEPDLNLISIAHQGTLLAIVTYFRRDLASIVVAVLAGLWDRRPLATAEARLGWHIALGTLPAAVVGLLLKERFEEIFGQPTLAALFLLVNGAILFWGERQLSGQRPLSGAGWRDALVVGVMQIPAILPGISRSGCTISAGLWRGFDRATAARFSFLLGVPAIAGAGLLALLDLRQADGLAAQFPALAATFAAAAVVGYGCIHFLMAWLRRRTLYGFAAYCGAFALLYLLLVSL